MQKFTFLFLLTSISIFSSCSSNDDIPTTDIMDEIVYEDSIIIVDQMTIVSFDSEPSGYSNYVFYLKGMFDEEIVGFYAELKLPIIEDDSCFFRPGTFSHSTSPDLNSSSFYYDSAELRIGDESIKVTAGEIIVSKNGVNFIFRGTLTLENGKDFTISYSGDLGMD
ncbi:hypothetical protein [uncultured Aquimarina sp.]|uniref:hypothetical protein n=1 Tax=uncultured Aquimarina sp. TaxID=575652 RepID=UPI002625AE29|nr:hypothetical protein [uncultured Aquimarina sp.]